MRILDNKSHNIYRYTHSTGMSRYYGQDKQLRNGGLIEVEDFIRKNTCVSCSSCRGCAKIGGELVCFNYGNYYALQEEPD